MAQREHDGHGHGHGHSHGHSHGPAVDEALETSAHGIRAVKISLVALGLAAVVQALLVVVTGSVALLADTIHNFSDALTALPLWAAFVLGRRPASRRFTYGLGRVEDLAGVFVIVMIALSAVLAAWESVRRLLDPQPLAHPWVVVLAGVVGFAGNELVAAYRIRVGRQIGSAALVADGQHARTDGYTSLAVVVGAVGAVAGLGWADPVVGLLITAAILLVLRSTGAEVLGRLLDGVDPEVTDQATVAAGAAPGVERVVALRIRWVGHGMTAELEVAADPALDLDAAHDLAHEVEHRMRAAVPRLERATVQVSPARP